MKKLLMGTVAVLALSASAAYAENTLAGNYYAGVGGFWTSIPDSDVVYNRNGQSGDRTDKTADWDGSFGLNTFVGYKLWQGNNLRTRVEGELAYRKLDLERDTIVGGVNVDGGDAWQFMVNGYVDVPLQLGFTPYVGLGAGLALADIGGDKGHDAVFAWQAIAGVSFSITDFAEIFTEYRYVGFDDIEFSTASNESGNFLEYGSHNVGLGVRFHF